MIKNKAISMLLTLILCSLIFSAASFSQNAPQNPLPQPSGDIAPTNSNNTPPTYQQVNAEFKLNIFNESNLSSENLSTISGRLKLDNSENVGDYAYYSYIDIKSPTQNKKQRPLPQPFDLPCSNILAYGRGNTLECIEINFSCYFTRSIGTRMELSYTDDRLASFMKKVKAGKYSPYTPETLEKLSKKIHEDASSLTEKLDTLFGLHATSSYHPTSLFSEEAKTWIWNNHLILLQEIRELNTSIIIFPLSTAQSRGITGVSTSESKNDTLLESLKNNVTKRSNEDVVLSGIPIQPPRGFFEATRDVRFRCFSYYLQYVGIPVSSYHFDYELFSSPKIFDCTIEAITLTNNFLKKNSPTLRLKEIPRVYSVNFIKSKIDAGIPILWRIKSNHYKLDYLTGYANRMNSLSPRDFAKQAKKAISNKHHLSGGGKGELIRDALIIGYNNSTDEIAIYLPDSEDAIERWYFIENLTDMDGNFYQIQ